MTCWRWVQSGRLGVLGVNDCAGVDFGGNEMEEEEPELTERDPNALCDDCLFEKENPDLYEDQE